MEFIAHRAGNEAATLEMAEAIADRVEIDVHLGPQTRVEARHAKILWPTRRLWERWYLLPPDVEVPPLTELLSGARDDTALWLDLKGFTRRLSIRTLAVIGDRRDVTVSTKPWWLLSPFVGRPGTRVIRSAGNRFELTLLLWVPSRTEIDGVVVNHRLLTDETIVRLQRRFGSVYTWGVTDVAAIERLARCGIDGVILDDLGLIEPGRVAAQQGNGHCDTAGDSQSEE